MARSTKTSPAKSDLLVRLGGILRDARMGEVMMSVAELSRRSGLSTRFIHDLEAGRANVSVTNLALLARECEISLSYLFEHAENIAVVGEAGTAAEALARIPAARPHVAVLDARLPDGSGIDVCRDVRSIDPTIKALILTSYDDDEALFAAIMAGAAGYILKQVRSSELVDGVRRVAAGQSLLDPAVTTQVLTRLRTGPQQDPRLAGLTGQERRILDCIAEGMSNREIAEHLSLAEKTVKNYVTSVLAKLGMQRRTQAAVFAARIDEKR